MPILQFFKMDKSEICSICGNHHSGDCSYEITYFYWHPEQDEPIPKNVQIVGAWHKWQTHEEMQKQLDQNGNVFFEVRISIPVGKHEFKYLVDGKWHYSKQWPIVQDPYGSYNNSVQVLPKKAFVEYIPKQDTRISSSIANKDLKIIGSWDNWKSQSSMELGYNSLKGCEENYIFLELIPNSAYQFKFKLRSQYLIDQKYPTVANEFGGLNNRIVIYKQVMSTPTGWRTNKALSLTQINCRSFQWNRVPIDEECLMYKQSIQGHSMVQIGQCIYIFGGRLRDDFTNRLVKINIHKLNKMQSEQVLPTERAYHCAQVYGNKMIIYGGHNKYILQDYLSFNTTQQNWISPPSIQGRSPSKRQKQSCVLYGMLLVFFGGYYCSPDFQFESVFNDIQVLDIQQMKWIDQKSIKVNSIRPEARYSHTATLVHSSMYVFGGKNFPQNSSSLKQCNLNDLWMINLEKVTQLKWEKVQFKGKPPTPRHGHTCNALQNYLIIFGGQSDQKLLNDVVVFDIQKQEWIYPLIKFHNEKCQPIPRAFHAATTINNQYIIVFGGKNKNLKSTSIYTLRPIDIHPTLDIEEDDDQDLETETNNQIQYLDKQNAQGQENSQIKKIDNEDIKKKTSQK